MDPQNVIFYWKMAKRLLFWPRKKHIEELEILKRAPGGSKDFPNLAPPFQKRIPPPKVAFFPSFLPLLIYYLEYPPPPKKAFIGPLKAFIRGLKAFIRGLKAFKRPLKAFIRGLKAFIRGSKAFKKGTVWKNDPPPKLAKWGIWPKTPKMAKMGIRV